jgi:hypothetical protein
MRCCENCPVHAENPDVCAVLLGKEALAQFDRAERLQQELTQAIKQIRDMENRAGWEREYARETIKEMRSEQRRASGHSEDMGS